MINKKWPVCKFAFSIIEILVVVSIISLLMGITLPAMNHVKSMAMQTVCQNRLHQWGYAFQIYSDDNNGFYPHIDGRDRTSSNPETDDEIADYYYGWIDVLPPILGEKPWRDHDYYNFPGKDTIFQCPSARLEPDKNYKYRPRRTGYFSYAMNSCIELDKKCCSPYGAEDLNWQMPSFLDTSRIKTPSRLIVLFDQLLDPAKGYNGKTNDSTAGQYCGSYPKAFSARHSKPGGLLGGSILYADYHVQWLSTVWKEEWPDDLEVPPLGDADWYPY